MNDDMRFKLFNILPAIIITIAICIIEKNPVAIVSFLIVYPIWAFLQISISERISFFNDERKKQSKLLTGLNISKTKWRKFSDFEKENHRKIYRRQENLKRKITNKLYPGDVDYSEYKLDNIIGEYNNEWLNFSMEERIKFMDNYEVKEKKEAERLYKIRYKNAGIKYKKERERERLKKIEDEKLKKIRDKENQIRLKKERELTRLSEEKERQLKEKEKELEGIKKKRQLEERKKQEKERYKEYYKRQQREKEKRRYWESEAIKEMIDSGEIDDNYSSDRKRTIPSNVKEIVYVRDKGCCVTCGSKENIEYDHIIPFSKGGSNSVNNIQLLCLKCNRGKSNKIM